MKWLLVVLLLTGCAEDPAGRVFACPDESRLAELVVRPDDVHGYFAACEWQDVKPR